MTAERSTFLLPSVCPLDCPDTCSLTAQVEGPVLVGVKGSRANPYTDGVICNKVARSYPEFVHGEGRLRHPLRRTGERGSGRYERITWDEALDLIYASFSEAIGTYGPQAVMPLNYAGPHGELAGGSMDRRFFHYMGATLLNRGPLCGAVRGTAYSSLFGAAPGMPPEQAIHADMIIVWGNNVSVSNLHLAKILKDVRAKGGKVVIVDPKRIKVAEQCDLHIQIHPGSDVVLALALAAEFERRGALDLAFIERWTEGFQPYMAEARRYGVAEVERICRIPADQFHTLADLYLSSKTVAASFGNGIERGHSGGSGLRAAMALQALTGNHGRLGAGVIAKSGVAAPKTQARLQRIDFIPKGTRTFNIVDVPEKLLDQSLDPPVKAVMIYNHNPVATHPDQSNMIKALMREDLFIAGADVAMTDSMAFADVILPAASHFEYDDIYGAYGQNYVQRARPVIPPVGESLPNTEIFRRLAARFGYKDPAFTASDGELMDEAMDGKDPHFQGVPPSRIALDAAIEMRSMDGGDLIMCKSVFPATPSGRIELFSQDLEDRFGYGVPRYEAVEQNLPLAFITPSSSKRTNATFGGCEASRGPETLEMNPADAARRSLEDGDRVAAWNERGRATFKLSVTDAVREGVIYSPKGAWRNTSDTGFTSNVLIPSEIRADIERGACYNETFVEVERC
ncbi:MAG: molybdopterin-dependent oxidoreductase [Kiloniellales bacterium]|nr:molybdopterin-dependent oxidoreductase [Kiloniellales bacterium]